LGVFDESERRRGKVSQARSHVRAARRPWPLSARLLVGAMLVVNILLVAFVVRTEIERLGAPATSTPLTVERPKAGPSPELNAPTDAPVSQGASPDQKTIPAEVTPAPSPGVQVAKRPASNALRAARTLHPVLPEPMPRAGVYPPQQPLGQTPAPARNPAASPGSSSNVPPPAVAASIATPRAGVPGNAGTPSNAPAPSVLAPPPATANGIPAKVTRSASTNRVASVGLPAMEKGLVIPKKPVAPISPKLEIVPRSAGKPENCGTEDAFVACPTLQIRPEGSIPSEDH